MKNIVALIGARSGSKGLPDKNILPLAGHPLLAWSVRAALATPQIGRVIVSTDSPFYGDIAKRYGAEFLLRPVELAQDDSPDCEFIFHALSIMTPRPDLVVHLRPTTPLRNPQVISQAISRLDPDATSLRSVHAMPESAWKSVLAGARWMTTLSGSRAMDAVNDPRQAFPQTFAPNGYVDLLSVDFMVARGFIHGDRVQPFVTPRVIEVDSAEDFALLPEDRHLRRMLFDDFTCPSEPQTA